MFTLIYLQFLSHFLTGLLPQNQDLLQEQEAEGAATSTKQGNSLRMITGDDSYTDVIYCVYICWCAEAKHVRHEHAEEASHGERQ